MDEQYSTKTMEFLHGVPGSSLTKAIRAEIVSVLYRRVLQMPSNGVTVSVTAVANPGVRPHMEDYIAVSLCPSDTLKKIPQLCQQVFVGVFDGHGGKEAAKFAIKKQMWETIQRQPKFLSTEVESICEAIKNTFVALHNEMVSLRHKCHCVTSPSILH